MHIYGPYLRRFPPLPVGPFAGSTGAKMQDNDPPQVDEDDGLGWIYNYETGDIIANTDDQDQSGTSYSSY